MARCREFGKLATGSRAQRAPVRVRACVRACILVKACMQNARAGTMHARVAARERVCARTRACARARACMCARACACMCARAPRECEHALVVEADGA
eukprot:6194195-Pleurochrysis_carterae.AAC.1